MLPVRFSRRLTGTTARVARRRADVRPAERIRAIHAASGGTYGSPRITAEPADDGPAVNHQRVQRVMCAAGIVGVPLRRKVRTTIPEPSATPVPDLLQRDFTAATRPAPRRLARSPSRGIALRCDGPAHQPLRSQIQHRR
ncbi:IS3 family transposase [Streptomyces sp. NPDC001652]|uniref:IS3 family transposase n=1 Tax=Streptomyces sp. NPDC001652 TaxID=3154393 RepID=UPI00331688A7